jgi:hypothetical protein
MKLPAWHSIIATVSRRGACPRAAAGGFGAGTVRRSIQSILVVTLISALAGCFGPDYGPTYGYPTYGYSPYSYGVPVYARGYSPDFTVHHPWEEHHGGGHHESFYHGPPAAPHFAGAHPGSGHAPGGHEGEHH